MTTIYLEINNGAGYAACLGTHLTMMQNMFDRLGISSMLATVDPYMPACSHCAICGFIVNPEVADCLLHDDCPEMNPPSTLTYSIVALSLLAESYEVPWDRLHDAVESGVWEDPKELITYALNNWL
jgi:hypothetical protein